MRTGDRDEKILRDHRQDGSVAVSVIQTKNPHKVPPPWTVRMPSDFWINSKIRSSTILYHYEHSVQSDIICTRATYLYTFDNLLVTGAGGGVVIS